MCPHSNETPSFSDSCVKLQDVQNGMNLIHQQLKDNAAHINRVETKLNMNNEATTELLDIVTMGKGFFKTAEILGRIIKWVLGIGTAILAFIVAWKSGKF